jgi:hypothetical protein
MQSHFSSGEGGDNLRGSREEERKEEKQQRKGE